MPVIGRLDGQVDEVLIKPLARPKGERGAAAAESAPPATPRDGARAGEGRAASVPEEGERALRRDELPVWLL